MSDDAYEIDFLPVGNGDRSGDAITVRYRQGGVQRVLVYDGGTQESGEVLVDHIRSNLGVTHVDYVVNSHPDQDHASGLSVVLEKLSVGELWMHRPWEYSETILQYFKDGRITDQSLAKRLKDKMSAAHALEEIAKRKRIAIKEPFQGSAIGAFYVLSPEKNWYVHDLVAEFSKSPQQKVVSAESYQPQGLISKAAAVVTKWLEEKWDYETLREDVETSAENESSVVLYAQINQKGILLTGDAGVRALTASVEYAEKRGVSLPQTLRFIQVPHHGSRHNVSPKVLDRLMGARQLFGSAPTKTAYVSAGKDSTTHPRQAVINAFVRRGAEVIPTKGEQKCHFYNYEARPNWGKVASMPFSSKVEAWE